MQAIINGEMYEVEPAVKVIIDNLMIENAELKKENARLEEGYQKSLGVIAATDCAECKDKSVKHGRWESCCNLMGEYFKCSECGYKAEVPTCMGEPIYIYCPNCGAKMDLKDGESK